MLTRALTSGLLGGFAAGFLAAVLHLLLVQPVLLAAERYESGELIHSPAAAAEDHHAASADGSEDGATSVVPSLALSFDPGRDGLTVLFFGLTYAGMGLLLVAAQTSATALGQAPPSPRAGLAWGIAGWTAFQLAPALGLPPELPGMAAADLAARQVWWWATATSTALGLAVLVFGRGWLAVGGGLALITALHVLGAPEPTAFTGPAPPELAALFSARALGVGLAAWLALGWAVMALQSSKVRAGKVRPQAGLTHQRRLDDYGVKLQFKPSRSRAERPPDKAPGRM